MTHEHFGLEPVLGRHPKLIEISNSELATFKEDRRKWYLGTYLGLQSKNQPLDGPLAFGTRIHNALELYYTDDQDPLRVWHESVQADRLWTIAEDRDLDRFDKEAELGRIMLEGYLEWLEETGADSGLEVVSAEEKLSAPIMDGRVHLIGKLDMRVRRKTDNVRLFVDHKTAAQPGSIKAISHVAWQPKMYMLLELLKKDEPERCDGMMYNILRKTKRTAAAKPPFYERVEVRHNRQTIQAFWKQVHGVASDIVAVRDALDDGADPDVVCYPNPTNDSTWKDPFFQVSALIDDGSAAERYIHDFYVQRNPLERYETGV